MSDNTAPTVDDLVLTGTIFSRYAPELLERVVVSLVKPRGSLEPDEWVARVLDLLADPVKLARRLQILEKSDPAARVMLALAGHMRREFFPVSDLLQAHLALGYRDGLAPLLALMETGLVLPDLVNIPGQPTGLDDFTAWLTLSPGHRLVLHCPLAVRGRAIPHDLGLPLPTAKAWRLDPPRADVEYHTAAMAERDRDLPPLPLAEAVPLSEVEVKGGASLSDGLEFPTRLGALWQGASEGPFRRTQAGDFYKRDSDRLTTNIHLSSPISENQACPPDFALLIAAIGRQEGLLRAEENDWAIGDFPRRWDLGTGETLGSLFESCQAVNRWGPKEGWMAVEAASGNPYPSACLLALLLMAQFSEGAWVRPGDIEEWLRLHHPHWKTNQRPSAREAWLELWLVGIAWPLRLVETGRLGLEAKDGVAVRLSPWGRWVLGLGDKPADDPSLPQSLFVQPNLEIVAYRQAMNPGMIARLSRLGTWKTLGAACQMVITPQTVYRALEAGESLDGLRSFLEGRSGRSLPGAVWDQLRGWAGKRERLAVHSGATLLEFDEPSDMEEAQARGVPLIRLSERFAIVQERDLDYRHFRLTGNRDYGLAREACVQVTDDGTRLIVDQARSDLLLETELPHLGQRLESESTPERKVIAITPESLRAAAEAGMSAELTRRWFIERTGQEPPPAIRLFLEGMDQEPVFQNALLLRVETEGLLDGLYQWASTASLLGERVGPMSALVTEANMERLKPILARVMGRRN
ncbi:MAG: hypothetical protein DWH88_04550 [Planctomycetota bacterium]|nr:MAG: hypothetical protein DWH88_04550 [Planctomycetota bacterium]